MFEHSLNYIFLLCKPKGNEKLICIHEQPRRKLSFPETWYFFITKVLFLTQLCWPCPYRSKPLWYASITIVFLLYRFTFSIIVKKHNCLNKLLKEHCIYLIWLFLYCLAFIPDPDFYPSRIPDPTTATLGGGEICCPTFFIATNIKKL